MATTIWLTLFVDSCDIMAMNMADRYSDMAMTICMMTVTMWLMAVTKWIIVLMI